MTGFAALGKGLGLKAATLAFVITTLVPSFITSWGVPTLEDAPRVGSPQSGLEPLALPDLISVGASPSNPLIAETLQPVSFVAIVQNPGGPGNLSSTLAFTDSLNPSTPFATFSVPSLPGSANWTSPPAAWTVPAALGTYSVSAHADWYNDVTESDESNNSYRWIVQATAMINTTLVVGAPNHTALHTFVNSLTPLSFSAVSRTGSPIAYSEYRIDGGNWTNYTGPFTLAGDGAHLLEYRSADILGGIEMIRVSFLIVDNIPPPSHLHSGQPSFTSGDTWITSSTPLTIDASESATGNASYVSTWRNLTVFEDAYDINETFVAYLARVNLTVTRELWPGLRSATFHINSSTCVDIDLGVFRDANGDGARQVTELQGLSGGSTAEETVIIHNPLPGSYIIAIAGYDVTQPQGCLVYLDVSQDVGGSASVGYLGVRFRHWSQGAWSNLVDYSGEFQIQGEGHSYVEHSSYDVLGNFEPVQNDTLHIDNTPPVSAMAIGSPNYIGGGNFINFSTPLSLQATDGGATPVGVGQMLYSIDGRGWYSYSEPISFMNEGVHAVEYRARDRLMNTEPIRSIEVIVDGTPPTTFSKVGAPNHSSQELYINSLTAINLTSNDGGQIAVGTEVVRYRLDGDVWSDYHSNITVTASDGLHTLEYTSRDLLGHEEKVKPITFFLDNAPPVSTLDPPGQEFTTETLFVLNVSDSGSGVQSAEYRIDGGGWIEYPGDFMLTGGIHNISYRSRDNLNNTEQQKWRVVNVKGATPSVEPNSKPLVALVFAIILAVVGYWSSRKKPWKGGKDRKAVAKAFTFTSSPFVLAETATGIVSLATGSLSIPPIIGVGTAVDSILLAAGVALAVIRVRRGKSDGFASPVT